MTSPIMGPQEYEQFKRREALKKKERREEIFYKIGFVVFAFMAVLAISGFVFHLIEEHDYKVQVVDVLAKGDSEELSKKLNDRKFIETLSAFDSNQLHELSRPVIHKQLIAKIIDDSNADLAALTLKKMDIPISIELLISRLSRSENNIADMLRSSGDERAALPLLAFGHDIGSLPDPRNWISQLCENASGGNLKRTFTDVSNMYAVTPLWEWQADNDRLSPSKNMKLSSDMTVEAISCIFETYETIFSYGTEKPVYGQVATGIKAVRYTWKIIVVDVHNKAVTAEVTIEGPEPPKSTMVNKFDRPDEIGTRPVDEYSSWLTKLEENKL